MSSFVFECHMILLVMLVKVMMSIMVECYHMSILMMSAYVNPVVAGCYHISSLVTSAEGRYNGSQRVLLMTSVGRGPMFWHRLGVGSN